MKKILFLFFFIPLLLSGVESTPRLILHFDVNRTLVASDSASGKSVGDVVNQILADKVEDTWGMDGVEPMTFRTYVKEYLVPERGQDPLHLKIQRDCVMCNFLQYLEDADHPLFGSVYSEFESLIEKIDDEELFSSFYALIDYLEKSDYNYVVVIRTFGTDIPRVVKRLCSRYGETFIATGGHMDQGDFVCSNGQECENFYSHLTALDRSIAVQDNYFFWFDHHRHTHFGKPFPVDLADETIVSVFFDDNIGAFHSPDIDIIAPYDPYSEEAISVRKLVRTKNVFKVETERAILDETYFIRRLESALTEDAFRARKECLAALCL